MEKIRLKCCPFCGDGESQELLRIGVSAFVRCNNCKTEGPYIRLNELLPADFHEMGDADKDAAWDNAKHEAMRFAVKRWNCRPPMSDCYPEDLETLEDDLKLKGGALYGSSVYKD